MKTQTSGTVRGRLLAVVKKVKVSAAAATGMAMMAFSPAAQADAPSGGALLTGMYKVSSSNDPLFPERERLEWFLDFGSGQAAGRTSGTLAVSMRENPNVKVKVLVWQIFGGGYLKVGARTGEGSKQAVGIADWEVSHRPAGLVLQRGNFEVVLNRADPSDY